MVWTMTLLRPPAETLEDIFVRWVGLTTKQLHEQFRGASDPKMFVKYNQIYLLTLNPKAKDVFRLFE